jgi:DNA-directed RNA polymerase subunit RPC12/RpoP
MPDIYFKCGACGNHLIVDEVRRGMSVACPDCQMPVAIPTSLSVHQCHHCGGRLMIASEMKGALVHCSSCHEPIRIPGQSSEQKAGDGSVVTVCPQCHANVSLPEEITNRPTPCPSCGEQVYFRDTVGFKRSSNVRLPKPKEHDELLFRRKTR